MGPIKGEGFEERHLASKSDMFRAAKRPPLMLAMAAIIPSGAVMGGHS
jgi:hypothetical protein